TPACTTALKAAKVGIDWIQKTFKAAYDEVMKAAEKIKKGIDFIKDPANQFEEILNDWVKGAGKFVQQAINKVVDTTGFDGSVNWSCWWDASTGCVVLISLVRLCLKTWADSAYELLEPGEMGSTLMPWGLVARIVMCIGPPIMYVFVTVSHGLVKVILGWMG